VVPLTKLDPGRLTIAVSFEIAPGRAYVVERVDIRNHTQIDVARAGSILRVRRRYSASALADYKRTLIALGAPSVAITTEPGQTADAVVVRVEIGAAN
jgi:hypothetical protein